MYVVAILKLATTIEAEAAALAADLGTTAYEERLKLAAGLPAIVLQSADVGLAKALATKVRGRGHGVLVTDSAEVVASSDMIVVRRFAFEADALALRGSEERLPYEDIVAIVRAIHRTRTETRTEKKDTSFSLGRALATGGLVLTKTTTREEKAIAQDRDAILYLFRASGETPWILHERSADYSALGSALAPSSAQNFLAVTARLRTLAPNAIYDERLTAPGSAPTRLLHVAKPGTTASSTASGVDLIAHLIAQWARREAMRGLR
ncbi:MAG: hypothetical protein U0441_26105 [Polyangiaceae bacterium]